MIVVVRLQTMCEHHLTNSMQLASKSGNEYGWHISHLPQVMNEAISKGLAAVGGQVQFCGEWCTAEAYWLASDPDPQSDGESDDTYIRRSWDQFMDDVRAIGSDQYRDAAMQFKCLAERGLDWQEEAIWIVYFSETATEQGGQPDASGVGYL